MLGKVLRGKYVSSQSFPARVMWCEHDGSMSMKFNVSNVSSDTQAHLRPNPEGCPFVRAGNAYCDPG